jgi:acyl-coenzyme A synthetase/AMP-(fatty) acid ligase
MRAPPGSVRSLGEALARASGARLYGRSRTAALGDLSAGSILGGRREELRGRSVVLAIADQLPAALALLELDGVARRLVLCPPDVPAQHLPHVFSLAEADVVISDRADPAAPIPPGAVFLACSEAITPTEVRREPTLVTEWILLTSGTTGVPKLVLHTLASLSGPIAAQPSSTPLPVWSTFYDIRRYGGLQVFLRAMLGGSPLVLSSAGEPVGEFLGRAAKHGVTHILGTPTHWRSALMSPVAHTLKPRYVRLSGEIADQAVLDHLQAAYPDAKVVHAFASTEAGVAFEVPDGKAGFPASLIGQAGAEVELEVRDGSLRIRSRRTAVRYLGEGVEPLRDADGFVDTGDMVELHGERYSFAGRRGGVINVGGQKIHPEEVEAVINSHPRVRISLVRARKSPITGAIVVADVVTHSGGEAPDKALAGEILEHCRARLARHKVPAMVNFVSGLDIAASGKLARRGA